MTALSSGSQRDRPRRSVLYVPASNARAIDKARQLPCDAVILDLEDAVVPEHKVTARAAALATIEQGGFGARELIVRINGLESEWGDADLRTFAASRADAILVPKVRGRADLLPHAQALAAAGGKAGLWAMIETAQCLFHLDAIAASAAESPLCCFVLGTNDLAHEMRLRLDATRSALAPALMMTVAAARAHGLAVLDGVFNAFDDDAGFAQQCQQGRDCGFDGKTLIHPRQIEACNAAFTPSDEALAWAQAIIEAFAQPQNAGKGALRVGGTMVEAMHLAQARQIVAVRGASAPQR